MMAKNQDGALQLSADLNIAHIKEEAVQTIKNHCQGVAALAASFAPAQLSPLAYQCGLYHDVGKYSDDFQKLIRGILHTHVDHSSAGAQLLAGLKTNEAFLEAFCVAGHHTGLLDVGTHVSLPNSGTFFARLKKQVPDYSPYANELGTPKPVPPLPLPNHAIARTLYFRMLFSCLVDADFLDTERFMSQETVLRSGYEPLETLYKRFFKVANKHLVFYSESSGFYRYFKSIIDWLLKHTNLTIHYVTNDPKDSIFSIAKAEPRIRPYYIGHMRIIPLFMKMDADMVVMTTPDLNTYQLKRSYVRKDVEYIYLDHAPASVQLTYRKGAFDHFDTIFANGQYQIDEHRATEKVYGLKAKKMVPTGYVLLDELFDNYKPAVKKSGAIMILIAPSHQPGNIFDSHLDEIMGLVRGVGREVHIRPHPQYTRRFPAKMQAIAEKYTNESDVVVEMDFSQNASIYDADILITDWSGIAYEYAFTTKRPVIFINTPMKVVNPEWERIGMTPTNITFRDMAGVSIDLDKLGNLPSVLDDILSHPDTFRAKIDKMLSDYFFNPGHSGEIAGRYILETLIGKKKGTKK